ncbi:MAG: PTS sugar transporter subunit IIA [Candidatus Omnitrophica bacterium]|nr:PTS sugar transporter subunit IIA [Candidatus Omnitrophota bacterium]MBU4479227.1 PTS sugar transporter subunit IIA [Candidatus Omnitrophota bacterium]
MNIGDYLKENRIILALKSKTKDEAIREIGECLKGSPDIVDFDGFLNGVFEREKLASTGIGQEVAIPHARTSLVKDFVIALGRSESGVEFNSVDAKPARLIFLMATPEDKGLNKYLKVLARLSRLLQKESFREALLKADSPRAIISGFQKIEK